MAPTLAQFVKKDEIYGNQTLYREIGYYMLRQEANEKSLKYFDEAIKYTPNDVRALIGRSRARASNIKRAEFLADDLNRALELEPDNMSAHTQKALSTYLSSEYENGLVQNTRLLHKRQKPENFRVGVMHCYDAIDTTIGEAAGKPLRDYFKIIRKLAWNKNRMFLEGVANEKRGNKKILPFFVDDTSEKVAILTNRKRTTEGLHKKTAIKDSLHSHTSEKYFIPPFGEEFPFHPLQKNTSNIKNFMAEKYLESMYKEKNFLENLSETGTSSPNKKGSEKIRYLAKTAYQMVSYKQELLRHRKPFYYIKYKEGTSTANLKTKQAQELFTQQQTTKREVDLLMVRLRRLCNDKQFRQMMDIAEKLITFCDSKSKRLLPNKSTYLEEIFTIIRRGYYQLYRVNPNQYPWDQMKRIYLALGLPISRDPSCDSVITESKPVFTDNKKQLQQLEIRLREKVETIEEICYCYYEMCKNCIDLKQYEIAKIYAKQCIQEAKSTNNLEWILITRMLLVRIYVQQGNKTDARTQVLEAKTVGEELGNENLLQYLDKCLELIGNIEHDECTGKQILTQRQNNILSLITAGKLKTEFSHLFRKMSALPASRRMNIMPGIRTNDAAAIKPTVAMSIAPDTGRKSDAAVDTFQTKLIKKQQKTAKGVGFMQLIQFHFDDGE